jgi:hypothetical protein
MTTTALPRSLDPLPDESLTGFLLRLSHRLEQPPARVAVITGLTGKPGGGPSPSKPQLGRQVHLPDQVRRRFATATRLTHAEVDALCVASYAARYSPLNPAFLGRRRTPERLVGDNWVFGRWTRYCPTCLAGDGTDIQVRHGGAWQRRWHLPPVFACVEHRRLLAHTCPTCRQGAHRVGGRDLPTAHPDIAGLHPVICRNRTVHGICVTRLDEQTPPGTTSTVLLHQLLGLQQELLTLLNPQGPSTINVLGHDTTASTYFTDLRMLASLINVTWPTAAPLLPNPELADALDRHIRAQHAAIELKDRTMLKTPRHAVHDQPPTDALAAAALIDAVHRMLTHTDPDTAAADLACLIDTAAAKPWIVHFLAAEPHCSAGLTATIADALAGHRPHRPGRPPGFANLTPRQPAHAPDGSTPQRPPRYAVRRHRQPTRQYQFGPQHIPAFLTDEWHRTYLADLDGISPRLLRRATALELLQRCYGTTAKTAAHFLHLPDTTAIATEDVLGRWKRTPDRCDQLDTNVEALITHIEDTALIDYRRRRDALSGWTIAPATWQQITQDLQRDQTPLQRRQTNWGDRKRLTASALVWVHVTSGEHLFAPHRKSPADARAGSTADHGLSIDRAWWRWHNNQTNHHYPRLQRVLETYASELAIRIDHHHDLR